MYKYTLHKVSFLHLPTFCRIVFVHCVVMHTFEDRIPCVFLVFCIKYATPISKISYLNSMVATYSEKECISFGNGVNNNTFNWKNEKEIVLKKYPSILKVFSKLFMDLKKNCFFLLFVSIFNWFWSNWCDNIQFFFSCVNFLYLF